MVVTIREERVRRVADAVRSLGLEAVLRLEELLDPQYAALQRLADVVGRGAAAAYAVLVAAVSYRLAMRGEEWWSCASQLLSGYPPPRDVESLRANVERFLAECRGSIIAREAKVSRVRRLAAGARDLLSRLLSDADLPLREPGRVLEGVARALGSEREAKTVAFSVKMAYYAARPRGSMRPLSFDLPMPVDVRVACVSVASGIVEVKASYRELVREPRPAQQAWAEVSRLSGVPTPHLDSLLWVVGWAPRDLPQAEARAVIERRLREASIPPEAARSVATELTYVPCR